MDKGVGTTLHASPTPPPRHCEEPTGPARGARRDDKLRDEAIQNRAAALDCFASLAMTVDLTITLTCTQLEDDMAKFLIEPHFRLHEWVAEEKGYFRAEGLDYEFKEFIRASDGAHHATAGKSGAFQSIEKGRESNVTCACHWTVNVAASRGHTKLFADAYSVAPSGIFVRADSKFRSPM